MDLRQLRYFVGIVQAGSLSRAADQMHVAQSALSHHLASLETELARQLVTRSPKGILLTEAGAVLYRHAEAILRDVEFAKRDAASVLDVPSGRVSIGFPAAWAAIVGYELFTRIRAAYPQILLHVTYCNSSMRYERLVNCRLDIAVLFLDQPERGLVVEPLLMEELFYVTAEPDASASHLSLRAARLEAAKLRTDLSSGVTPEKAKEKRARERARAEAAKAGSITFGQCAEEVFKSLFQSWRSKKHEQQWRLTLDTYFLPIAHLPVSKINVTDVLSVVGPLWGNKQETAIRVRGRIERVLDHALAKDYRTNGDNPARWKGKLQALLPPPKPKSKRVKHLAAMPYADVPAFMVGLRKQDTTVAKALEFIILTAARNGEVLHARWSEIDFTNKQWKVPKQRMKAEREHIVPLSERALAILHEMENVRQNELIFPGFIENRPLADNQPLNVLRRAGLKVTTHGFRSSFRDWCGDCTHYPREIAEAALAHTNGDQTERAYRRGTALEQRRKLMDDWANYCEPKAGNVIAMKGKPIPGA
jgi:DNA-binding transcriptional LysR family regulator/integrase